MRSSSPSAALEPDKASPQKPVIPLIDDKPVEPFQIAKKIRNEITSDKKFFDFNILSREFISEQNLLTNLSRLWALQFTKPQKNRVEELIDEATIDQVIAHGM